MIMLGIFVINFLICVLIIDTPSDFVLTLSPEVLFVTTKGMYEIEEML